MKRILTNKVAIITGANQGLGFEIAKKYVFSGADLMICARNKELLEDSLSELIKLAKPNQRLLAQEADISKEGDVDLIIDKTTSLLGGCDVLVNNAEIYGPKGNIEDINWEEWKKAIDINLYGSILMCRKILPLFKLQASGKIIQLSGGGATSPLPFMSAYAVSKAGIVRFIETLAEEVRGSGIDINAIAPGALNTNMLEEVLAAGPDKVGEEFYASAIKQKESGGVPLEQGANLALFLASKESNGITGKLISAVWDNWKDWPNHLKELSSSQAYTLRRISGRDVGFDWGDK